MKRRDRSPLSQGRFDGVNIIRLVILATVAAIAGAAGGALVWLTYYNPPF